MAQDASTSSRWNQVATIVATLVAALGGAWIGGVMAIRTQQAAAEQQRDLEKRSAQTAARLLGAELSRLDAALHVATDDACWWRGSDYTLRLPEDDRRLLAANLPRSDYDELATVLLAHGKLEATLANGFEWRPGAPSTDMRLAVALIDGMRDLVAGLADFAKASTQPMTNDSLRVAAWRKDRVISSVAVPKHRQCNERRLRASPRD